MARGFGSTLGVGATDVLITPNCKSLGGVHTLSLWFKRNGDGGVGYGHLAFNSTDFPLYWASPASFFAFQFPTTGAANSWSLDSGFATLLNFANVWNHLVLIVDTNASIGTTPVGYCNGQPLSISVGSAGSGTRLALAKQWYIGNALALDRVFDGLVEDFAIFDGALTLAQANALYRGANPRTVSRRIRDYLPLRETRPVSALNGSLATITGTRPRRGRWQSVLRNNPRLVVPPAVITGTLDATEAADTAAIAGDVLLQGSLSATEAADTAAIAGTVPISGTLDATEAPDTAEITGPITPSTRLHGRERRRIRGRRIIFPDELDPVPEIVPVPPKPSIPWQAIVAEERAATARIEQAIARVETGFAEAKQKKALDRLRTAHSEAVAELREAERAERAWIERLHEEDELLLLA